MSFDRLLFRTLVLYASISQNLMIDQAFLNYLST